MDKKKLHLPLDAALSKVDPERRRLLEALLAGAAALPLVTSTVLSASGQTDEQTPKTKEATVKHGPLDYDKNSAQIKASDTKVKSASPQIKSSAPIKADTRVKTSDAAIKSASTQMKSSSAPTKSSTSPQ
jgi:hypothetical protein